MAKAKKPCDWCKKRRVCEDVQVVMRGPSMLTLGDAAAYPLVFARNWKLCSQCRATCEGNLKWVFRARPE